MKHPVLWFISLCMSIAFIQVAFFHQSPEESLAVGAAGAVGGTTMEFVIMPRLAAYFRRRA
jgi:hypothetical protein